MNIEFALGTQNDINELEDLYNNLNDYLEKGTNYPGWKKGIYPTIETAINGVNNRNLFIAKNNGKIIGSVILSHEPEVAYNKVTWQFDLDYSNIFVIYTFVVHPDYLKCGVGKKILDFAINYGQKQDIKAIRLDVFEKNIPAINLYEKCGFKYIDTIDLELGIPDLVWFKLYELIL